MATESSIEIQKLKDCRQQNEHYWRIIEKQKAMIQNLQTSLAQLTDSYEVLYQRKKDTDVPDFDSLHVTHQIVEILEQESKELVQHKVPDQLTLGPVPPPRSPYRINQGLLPHTNIPDTSTPENNRVGQPSQNTSDYHKRPPALHLSISNHSNKNKHINQEVLLSPHRTQSAFSPLSPDSFSSGSDYTVSRSFNEHYTKTGEDITTLSLSSPTYLPSYHNNTQLYPLTPTRTIFDRNEHSQSNPSIINLKYLKPSLSEPNTPIKGRTPRYDSLTTNSVPNSCHMTSFDTSANRRRLLAEIKDVTVKFIHSVAMNEDPTIVLSVRRRISPQQKELWCIEKRWSELNTLDYNMRRNHCTMTEYKVFPDKILFASQTSSKLDQRKYVVEAYFKYLISIKPLNPAYLIDFLDSGVINKKKKERMTPQETVYEGHLSQLDTGCNINRYYVLESNGLLKYSDHKDSPIIGTIHLFNSKIGHQITNNNDMGSRYRHAFFILERNNSSEDSIKHILYAESEIEREAWLAALRNYIHIHITDNILNSTFMFEKDNTQNTPNTTGDICIESPSIDKETVPKKKACTNGFKCQGNTPISTESNQSKAVVSEVIPVSNELEDSKKMFKNRSNRRTFWAKVKFSSSNGSPPKMASLGSRYPQHNSTLGSRQVFGIPLEYAVSISRSSANDELPAIVHRCIEYIEAKGGLNEEGIYRLSGSAANIKTLKKRFNEEGDLNLLEDNCCHDVHEVAGLLKMWLRELPENIMTNALLSKFFGSLGLESQQQKVHEMGRLVSLLPVANYNLIQSLCAHLIRIVDNSDMNKMTMRNMSIVFSATLEIPSGVFTLLLTHFDYIFWSTRCSGDPLATIEQYMEDVSSDDSTVFDSSIDNSSSFSSNTSSIQTSVRIKTCSLGQYQDTAPNDLIRNERQLNVNNISCSDDEELSFCDAELETAYVASRYTANSKRALI